jgi:predicted NBD/HSP70 family sugar kinase
VGVPLLGGVEAGGTKVVCAAGTGPGDVVAHASFPTATAGWITETTKPGWSRVVLAGAFRRALGVPVAVDTDVNGAALGEQRWGAGVGFDPLVYVTVGTGIGGGAVVTILAGYVRSAAVTDAIDDYIVPPALGERAGVLGALALAHDILSPESACRQGTSSTS